MAALVVYILAGIAFCWSFDQQKRWQRALMVPFWLPMITYGMLCEFSDWLGTKGYQYPDEEE